MSSTSSISSTLHILSFSSEKDIKKFFSKLKQGDKFYIICNDDIKCKLCANSEFHLRVFHSMNDIEFSYFYSKSLQIFSFKEYLNSSFNRVNLGKEFEAEVSFYGTLKTMIAEK